MRLPLQSTASPTTPPTHPLPTNPHLPHPQPYSASPTDALEQRSLTLQFRCSTARAAASATDRRARMMPQGVGQPRNLWPDTEMLPMGSRRKDSCGAPSMNGSCSEGIGRHSAGGHLHQ